MVLFERLYFIVNRKSGNSNKVLNYLRNLKMLLIAKYPQIQWVELNLLENQWQEVLLKAKPQELFIACGGDGTVSSVAKVASQNSNAHISILPFGTGNDFARIVGMYFYRKDYEKMINIFSGVEAVYYVFDIWRLQDKCFVNYFSFGFDATVTMRFHNMRSRISAKVQNPFVNRFLYIISGITAILYRNPQNIVLNCNNKIISVGESKVVLFSNINSYAGGHAVNALIKQDDQQIEVIVKRSFVSFLKMMLGFSSKIEAKAKNCQFSTKSSVNCQIDGESFVLSPGEYQIEFSGKVKVVGGYAVP